MSQGPKKTSVFLRHGSAYFDGQTAESYRRLRTDRIIRKRATHLSEADLGGDTLAPAEGAFDMTKQDIIDDIRRRNRSADSSFLSNFNEHELLAYLQHLREVEPELARAQGRPTDSEMAAQAHRRSLKRPRLTSHNQYMVRPLAQNTTCTTRRHRFHVQLG
jgi:hypothetical protein